MVDGIGDLRWASSQRFFAFCLLVQHFVLTLLLLIMQLKNETSHVSIPILQPDTITGDIVFVVQEKEHPKFKRKIDDLEVEHTLSLTEALCGFQFVLTHLDGRQLLIKSNPGEIIKPGKFCPDD